MKRLTRLVALALPTLLWTGCADRPHPLDPEAVPPLAAAGSAGVVQVDPPTGDPEFDRANIIAALERVQPGGTVQFAQGTYVIGMAEPFNFIQVTVPHVTLLGHRRGTTLRGCDPAEIFPFECVGLELSGGHQTVRNFTFEDFGLALVLGKLPFPAPAEARTGGYRVEGSTFRNSLDGIAISGQWSQPALVRNNRFRNVGQAVVLLGRTAYVLDNVISAPEPEQIPFDGEPFAGILGIGADFPFPGTCDQNVITGNRIDGYRWGVGIEVLFGASCRHNLIRGNTIDNSRVLPGFDLGAPLFVWNYSDQAELMQYNLVTSNRVRRAEGVGVVILRASRNLVGNNTIRDITLSPVGEWLGAGNGSGVWVSPGSEENSILANIFARTASYDVVLEGDRNLVATRSGSDRVRDLGTGNLVIGPGHVTTQAAPTEGSVAAAPAAIERAEAVQMLGQQLGPGARWLGWGARQEAAPR